ncbi:diguanylate cyclase (GGDEF) domain-containing protein [Ruminococcus sp. YRD2003]|uniref:GGDEF domain-containing protein n=1 Tax=Ruminococcus sp. YRD2003 TaxID=1452313 RepID=UPI0008CB894D|nr:diguanylate cyclase (GGDEF) domain-containing protein [Ruminococcus flavefaciens]
MYYSSIGIISLIVLVIINIEALRKVRNTSENEARLKYRQYLFALISFFIADIMWGFFYEQRWLILTYIDTCMFFGSMVLSVLCWTRGVVAFAGSKGRYGKILVMSGWAIFLFEFIVLAVNLFFPIVFTFGKGSEYMPLPARYIGLLLQMILFLVTSVYSMIMAVRSKGISRSHYRTISISGIIMCFFIAVQMLFPLMPFYSMGCLFGTCLIHTFVYRDKDAEHNVAIDLAKQKAYKDGLTGVKNKLSYLEALAELETSVESGELTEYGIVVFDLNGLKSINDTLGHEAGDEYIKSGCSLICRSFNHSPVFRVGGDEFVAILKGEDYANREELVRAFREKIRENQKNGEVVVASGLAVYDASKDTSYNDVFKRADESMYEQKRDLKSVGVH